MLPPRAWCNAVVESMLPPDAATGLRGVASADLEAFWRRVDAHAPGLLRLGIWAAVVTLVWLPLVRYGRPLHRLDPLRRDRVVAWAGGSRIYLVRQLAEIAKTLACFAYFDDPGLRAAFKARVA